MRKTSKWLKVLDIACYGSSVFVVMLDCVFLFHEKLSKYNHNIVLIYMTIMFWVLCVLSGYSFWKI